MWDASPDFERSIATARSRGISFLMCAQSLSQLDGVYGESTALTILDNCDSLIYMGWRSNIATQKLHKRNCVARRFWAPITWAPSALP